MNLVDAERMTVNLMELHGLNARGWSYDWNRRLNVTFGLCSKKRKVIELNPYMVEMNDEEDVRDTVLHEIAHALCRSKRTHGAAWKAIARSIGADPSVSYGLHVKVPLRRSKFLV